MTPSHWFGRAVRVLGAAGVLFTAEGALAQSEADLAKARKFYEQGLTQEAASDWGGALASFEQVRRIKATPQVRYHIARCVENLGRLNEALGGYRLAEHEAGAAGVAPEVLAEITAAREALEGRIPKLVIERGEGTETAQFELDGVALGAAQLGRPVNVDPGPHVVVATLRDGTRVERKVEALEGQSTTVKLEASESPVTTTPNTAPATPPPPDEEDDEFYMGGRDEPPADGPKPKRSPAPFIVGGLGLGAVGAGVVFMVLRSQAEQDLESECLGTVCPESARSTQDQGELYSTLAPVSIGVGAAAIVAGTVMVAARGPREAKTARWWNVEVRSSGAEVRFGARF